MEYVLLLCGIIVLLLSGKYLVQGSVSLANQFHVSKLVIGVTVVSFGTSAPELFVSTRASLTGSPDIAIGNIIGSNIANIALVLAITAIIFPILVRKNSVKIDAPFLLIVSGLLFLFLLDLTISRTEGAIFVLLLGAYLLFTLFYSRKHFVKEPEETTEKNLAIWLSLLMVLLSAGGLALGSALLVDNAELIALSWGVSERVISITIVAFGTSLPELVTSAIAAFKKEMDISIGNIIGSNIFNILAVLGVASLLKPMDVAEKFLDVDIFWMLSITVLLFLFILPLRGGKLTRLKGFILFAIYGVYIYFLIKQ